MARTWQTDEVIRCLLAEADLDEIIDIIEEAEEDGHDAAEAIKGWVREGNAPKSLYDAVMRFTTAPDQAFDPVDWEAVVRRIKKEA